MMVGVASISEWCRLILSFFPDPVLVSQSITVPESVGDAEVCVRLENSVERPFTIFYRTSDNTAQSTLIAFFSSYHTFVYVTVTKFI